MNELDKSDFIKKIQTECSDFNLIADEKLSSHPTFICAKENYFKTIRHLKNNTNLNFDMLCSHTCVDWPVESVFELLTLLFSTQSLEYIWISVKIDRTHPEIDTLSSLFKTAEFQEREVFDLFGVIYKGHKDLRRVFLEDDWVGFPLRKDYVDDFILVRPEN